MKQIVVLIIVVFAGLQGRTQLFMINSTEFQISPISVESNLKNFAYINVDRTWFNETFYWQKRYNETDKGKIKYMYNFHSLYKRETVIGVCVYGVDMDIMPEQFRKKRANKFRYWNKLRIGFKFLVESNPQYELPSLKDFLNYINEEFSFSYLHLPRLARGDQMTKYRKGSFMVFITAIPSQTFTGYMKYKALGSTWFKVYFRREYRINHTGILAEVELNKRGFDQSIIQPTHDIYHGWSLMFGPEFTPQSNRISFYLGIKLDIRNH